MINYIIVVYVVKFGALSISFDRFAGRLSRFVQRESRETTVDRASQVIR